MAENNTNNIAIERVNKTLSQMGYNPESIKPKHIEYLLKIDESIQAVFTKEEEVKKMLSRSVVSIKGVATDTGISNKTFYNNPILAEYVNFYAKEFDKVDMSKKQNNSDNRIKELEEQLRLMHYRDIEFEEMKLQVEKLKKAIKERDEVIENLRNNRITAFPIKR